MWAENTTQNYIFVFMLHKAIQKKINDEIFSPIGLGWKKINVEQRDKSHMGSQRKEKHIVVYLIQMGKKSKGPQKGQKNEFFALYCTNFSLKWTKLLNPLYNSLLHNAQQIPPNNKIKSI